MSNFVLNLPDIYNQFFANNTYHIPQKVDNKKSVLGTPLSYLNAIGKEVFLPVSLWMSDKDNLQIDCCTIRVTAKKTIIRTAVSEQQGTIKEQFNIDDYQFTIKGVLIDKNFPDQQIIMLKRMFESNKPIELLNALTDLFLDKSHRIAIENLELPETEGKSIRMKPFILTCESDFIDTLIVS